MLGGVGRRSRRRRHGLRRRQGSAPPLQQQAPSWSAWGAGGRNRSKVKPGYAWHGRSHRRAGRGGTEKGRRHCFFHLLFFLFAVVSRLSRKAKSDSFSKKRRRKRGIADTFSNGRFFLFTSRLCLSEREETRHSSWAVATKRIKRGRGGEKKNQRCVPRATGTMTLLRPRPRRLHQCLLPLFLLPLLPLPRNPTSYSAAAA